MLEATFLIPLRRDAESSDGKTHSRKMWRWLERELYLRFSGITRAPGECTGFWQSPKTRAAIVDRSRMYLVALPRHQLQELRSFLAVVGYLFGQQSLYLSVAGHVEFIKAEENDGPRGLP